ncbi:MAG: hypothetical protein ACXABY_24130 [Candidatus Thorarchaeota archaeon]|jgi:hypothetical protein
MAVDDSQRLGYGGSAVIDGQQVLITGGSFNTGHDNPYLEPWSIPASAGSRSRVSHADGTEAYSGEVSLDVTDNFLSVLTTAKLFARRYQFDVGIHNGEVGEEMTGCYLTSLTVSGAPGGLVNASVSFVGATAPASAVVTNAFIRDDEPLGYWYSGNVDVREWTLTMNQVANPVYINQDVVTPRYIKVGMVDYALDVVTFDNIIAYSNINIKTSAFTLTGVTASESYSFGGPAELGGYQHSFETAADATTGSGGIIIA